MFQNFRSRSPRSTLARVAVAAVAVALPGLAPTTASVTNAIGATPPIIWLDATNPDSYPGFGTLWTDLSPSGWDGTLENNSASITYDAETASLRFPGGANGTAFVRLAANMRAFTDGLSIEFEGEFGASRADWERIFDFSEGMDSDGPNATDNALWIGQFYGTNEMAIEVIVNGTFPGYCHTATDGTALGPSGDRSFNKWMITVGPASGTQCRIFKNGVELPTRVFYWNMGAPNLSPTGANNAGSSYSLPPEVDRTSSFLGRSNFVADNDFEGSIRYIRLYDRVLSPSEVEDNSTATVSFDPNGGTGSMEPQTSVSSEALRPNTFERDGHGFLGWSFDPDASEPTYEDEATFPFSSDATLYAVWDGSLPSTGSDSNGLTLAVVLSGLGVAAIATVRRRSLRAV